MGKLDFVLSVTVHLYTPKESFLSNNRVKLFYCFDYSKFNQLETVTNFLRLDYFYNWVDKFDYFNDIYILDNNFLFIKKIHYCIILLKKYLYICNFNLEIGSNNYGRY